MRISGGDFKGRKIKARGLGRESAHGALRATSAKVREAVFNILMGRVEGAKFVDLYAGSGTMGMEAMSRGAGTVYFVESDPRRAEAISKMLEGCGCQGRAKIVNMDAVKFLEKSARAGDAFDIIFMDPPYDSDEFERVMPALAMGRAINDDAVIVAEHGKRQSLPESIGVLKMVKQYRYGDTVITTYKKEQA